MMSLRAAPSSAAAMFRNSANLLFAVTSLPEHEGLADALDGVAQPFVRFRHAFFGELLFGDVDGDADEPVACAAAAPHLALRMHPHPASVRVAQPERRVVGTRGTVRRLRDLVDRRRVLGMRHRLDLGGQEPFRRLLQPHHVEHGGRPVDAVLAHVPVPDAAARARKGHVEAMLVLDQRRFRVDLALAQTHQHVGNHEIPAGKQARKDQRARSAILDIEKDVERCEGRARQAERKAWQQARRQAAALARPRFLLPPDRVLACRCRVAHPLFRQLPAAHREQGSQPCESSALK
jgi:hypothetical protein